jgi:GrpB-like predicted nucleotidyltransferase (UPF0157 family)
MTDHPIEVLDPDPLWPALFEAEARRLSDALGPALRALEHVGSTSVPGLAAKPILDVMAALDDLGDLAPRLSALAALGYELRPTDMSGRLYLRREPRDGDLPVHLHVVTLDAWPSCKERRFRDRLRAHPEEAAAYAALKRDLARRFRDDREGYTRAKTALIQEIMDRAADEAGLPREDVWET